MRGWKRLGVAVAAVLIVFGVLPYLLPMQGRGLPPRKSPYFEGRFTDVCGLRWHFQRWLPSDAAPARSRVVLIHGYASSTFSWRLTGPALAAAGHEVLAIDLPSFGYTTRGMPDQPLADCVARIVRDEAGDLPVVLVGHSMGAGVAARAAVSLKGPAVGLVLVDGGLHGRSHAPAPWVRGLAYPPFSRWAEVLAHYHQFRPERFAKTLASAYGRTPTEDEIEGYRVPLLLAGTAPRVLAIGPMTDTLDVMELPSAQLIVWGRRDTWMPAEVAERTAAALPAARLVWIEEAAHNPMETHSPQFVAVLGDFLDTQLPARE